MASYIAEARGQYGEDRVLAVDIGDHLDRMRQETEGTCGSVNIALLNAAGYEAGVPGNNEGLTFHQGGARSPVWRGSKFPRPLLQFVG